MTPENGTKLLKALGASSISANGKKLICSCPFAPWKHKKGTDSNPSFALFTGASSHYWCFSCHSKGKPGDLILELLHLGASADFKEAYEILDLDMDSDEGYSEVEDWTDNVKEIKPWPEKWLNSFPDAWKIPFAREYLQSRNITEKISNDFELKADTGKQRVCFPVRDRASRLIGMRGRNTTNKLFHDYSYKGIRNNPLWLNAHRIDLAKPIILVESSFDVLSVYRYYSNVTAPLTAGIKKADFEWLQTATEILLFFDNDDAGHQATSLAYKYLSADIEVSNILYPPNTEGEDPSSLPSKTIKSMIQNIFMTGK